MLDLRFTTSFRNFVEFVLQFFRRAAGQQKACCKCSALMLPKRIAVGDDTRRSVTHEQVSEIERVRDCSAAVPAATRSGHGCPREVARDNHQKKRRLRADSTLRTMSGRGSAATNMLSGAMPVSESF